MVTDRDAAIRPLCPVGMALHGVQNFFRQVVHINQLQFHCRVGNGDRQVTGDVVAEGGHGGIVVGAAPFSEQIGQAVDHPGCASFSAIGKKQLLRRLLGLPIGTPGIPSGQTGLNGGGEQYRAAVTAFQKHLQQSAGEVCVSDCKFSRILGPVHASQVDHEICLFAVVRQGLCRSIPRTQENFLDLQCGPGPVSMILDGRKALRQIFPDKSICAGNQYIHQQVPPNSFSFRRSCFISSTFSRCVL